jgi:hypothetical protein
VTIFRRSSIGPRRAVRLEPWPGMLPQPVPADPGLCGAWITHAPLNAAEDPCGRPPLITATSSNEKSGAGA